MLLGEIFRLMEIMLYFEIISMLPKREIPRRKKIMITITDRLYNKTFVYDIQADKIEELQIPDMPKIGAYFRGTILAGSDHSGSL